MPVHYHILFWIFSVLLLVAGFGRTYQNYGQAFYFVSFLLPVAMGTSYFFNYYLVPSYLFQRRIIRFTVYLLYTIVISLLLQMIVITIAFIVIANYNYGSLNPLMSNIFVLFIAVYVLVLLKAFILLYLRIQRSDSKISKLEKNVAQLEEGSITVRSNRNFEHLLLKEILYLESFGDYVKIHTRDRVVTTRKNISDLDESLPYSFIRIHRSFIVNRDCIERYSSSEVHVNNIDLPISRTYKKQVLDLLNSD
ncbi:LytR/AlgR family response regulator transcription factor [Rhodohalobacter mucosus]|uniref:HTH LytTR-type domain-containing protein n=1 Tax=Rhodohalobacter mucosus TaxID=2079485 RepID=A0A316U2M9_9BACT|nr:LytTR family DNA-binding domain-containing protein [Rhodohalobacter mucosus]PWN07546.1 hypothetical protein DDZ15_04635 [Rhodohalobacter mucosus]